MSIIQDMDEKRCPKCEAVKPVSEFHKNAARPDGLATYCKPCHIAATTAHHQKARMEVIDLLGGPTCVRCGFDDVRALTIDHIHGGGAQHRKDAVSLWKVLQHVKAHPTEYQVLCWNCNHIKRHEQGEWSSTEYRAKVLASPREKVVTPVRWARKYDSCQGCGTTTSEHKSKGLCENCYMRLRRRGTTEKVDLSSFRSDLMSARWADPEKRQAILDSKRIGPAQLDPSASKE